MAAAAPRWLRALSGRGDSRGEPVRHAGFEGEWRPSRNRVSARVTPGGKGRGCTHEDLRSFNASRPTVRNLAIRRLRVSTAPSDTNDCSYTDPAEKRVRPGRARNGDRLAHAILGRTYVRTERHFKGETAACCVRRHCSDPSRWWCCWWQRLRLWRRR